MQLRDLKASWLELQFSQRLTVLSPIRSHRTHRPQETVLRVPSATPTAKKALKALDNASVADLEKLLKALEGM